MTDRELLEAAAKAAGIELACDVYGSGPLRNVTGADPLRNIYSCPIWNPLTDDGDALRLATKLHIRIYPPEPHLAKQGYPNSNKASTNVFGEFWCAEDADGIDPCAAVRRAIVTSAAALVPKNGDRTAGCGRDDCAHCNTLGDAILNNGNYVDCSLASEDKAA